MARPVNIESRWVSTRLLMSPKTCAWLFKPVWNKRNDLKKPTLTKNVWTEKLRISICNNADFLWFYYLNRKLLKSFFENSSNFSSSSEEYSLKILSHDNGLVSFQKLNRSGDLETTIDTPFFAVSLSLCSSTKH